MTPPVIAMPALRPGTLRGIAAGALGLMVCIAGCGTTRHYGTIPSFLPKTTVPVDRIVLATPGHPQLAVQGATVKINLPAGSTLATVVGPAVPPFVLPPPPAVTATFTLTFAQNTGSIPLRVADFSVHDVLGHVDRLLVPSGAPTPPPAALPPGHVTFRLSAVLPIGHGDLLWSPGGHNIATWDFVVEND